MLDDLWSKQAKPGKVLQLLNNVLRPLGLIVCHRDRLEKAFAAAKARSFGKWFAAAYRDDEI